MSKKNTEPKPIVVETWKSIPTGGGSNVYERQTQTPLSLNATEFVKHCLANDYERAYAAADGGVWLVNLTKIDKRQLALF